MGSETIVRDVEGLWSFKGHKVPRDEEDPIGGHRKVARELINAVFSWGNLSYVGLVSSLRNEGFVPPCE